MIKYEQAVASDSASKSASKNVDYHWRGRFDSFCDCFGIFIIIIGVIAAFIGFILIFVGAGAAPNGPNFYIITAAIILIAIGVAFGVFGFVSCCLK